MADNNVYTYYEHLGSKTDSTLVNMWVQSWKKHGWNPVVLDRKTYMQKPMQKDVEETTRRLSTITPIDYSIAANMRWLAWTQVVGLGSLVCDYDVLNYGFTPDDIIIPSQYGEMINYSEFGVWGGIHQVDESACYKVLDLLMEYNVDYFFDKPWSACNYTFKHWGKKHCNDMIAIFDYCTAKYSVHDDFFKTDFNIRWVGGCKLAPDIAKLIHYANGTVGGNDNRINFIMKFEKENGLC